MKANPVRSRSVLITGCSSGIGRAAARLLREKGWTVWPTARKPGDLEDLRRQGFDPISLDMADSASVQQAAAAALQRGEGPVGALVNNAGFGQPGAIEDLSRDVMRAQFEVNVLGLQELTNLLIPAFRKQGYGRIVNISSVLGKISIPFMGMYAASKHALEAMSDSLRVELWNSGVAVSIIEPGPIETAFRKNAFERGRDTLDLARTSFATEYESQARQKVARGFKSADPFTAGPEAVARVIQHALESRHPRARYPVTLTARVGIGIGRWLPAWLTDRLLSLRLSSRR